MEKSQSFASYYKRSQGHLPQEGTWAHELLVQVYEQFTEFDTPALSCKQRDYVVRLSQKHPEILADKLSSFPSNDNFVKWIDHIMKNGIESADFDPDNWVWDRDPDDDYKKYTY